MSLQYVSDEQGRYTAVIVPIEEWNSITANAEKIKANEKAQRAIRPKPSDFRGTISNPTADALLHHIEQARKEWESHTS